MDCILNSHSNPREGMAVLFAWSGRIISLVNFFTKCSTERICSDKISTFAPYFDQAWKLIGKYIITNTYSNA